MIAEKQMQHDETNNEQIYPIRYYSVETRINEMGELPAPVVTRTVEYTMVKDSEYAPRDYEKNSGFVMPLGYEVRFNKLVTLNNDAGLSTEAACYNLMHDDELVQTFCVDWEYTESTRVLFEEASRYISQYETPEAVEWMRKIVCPENQTDIPPWERSEPLKDKYLPEVSAKNTYELSSDTINYQYFSMTDEANGERFRDEANGWLIYTPSKDRYAASGENWSAWVINRYEPAGDKLGTTLRLSGKKPMQVYDAWKTVTDSAIQQDENHPLKRPLMKLVNNMLEFARNCQGQAFQRNALAMVEKSTKAVCLENETNYNIIAFRNGAVDVSTGRFYHIWECDQLKSEYPTVYIDCTYYPDCKSKKWIESLVATFTDNTTDEYLQKGNGLAASDEREDEA